MHLAVGCEPVSSSHCLEGAAAKADFDKAAVQELHFQGRFQGKFERLGLAGGGAVEAALSISLETFATTLESREQLAIAEFANALLIIPKILAVNAAKDATDLIAKLRAYHYAAQTKSEKKHLNNYGLDLQQGSIRDNVAAGVLEPVLAKTKIIQVRGVFLSVS